MPMQVEHVAHVLVCYPTNGVHVCLETATNTTAVALHRHQNLTFEPISVGGLRYAEDRGCVHLENALNSLLSMHTKRLFLLVSSQRQP